MLIRASQCDGCSSSVPLTRLAPLANAMCGVKLAGRALVSAQLNIEFHNFHFSFNQMGNIQMAKRDQLENNAPFMLDAIANDLIPFRNMRVPWKKPQLTCATFDSGGGRKFMLKWRATETKNKITKKTFFVGNRFLSAYPYIERRFTHTWDGNVAKTNVFNNHSYTHAVHWQTEIGLIQTHFSEYRSTANISSRHWCWRASAFAHTHSSTEIHEQHFQNMYKIFAHSAMSIHFQWSPR